MSEVSLSNVINVSVATPPTGLADYKVNNIAIFTAETPVTSLPDVYEVYKDAASVATRWGSASEMALQANAIFAQSPNILSGNGSLIGIPLLDLLASAGTFTTADITANIDNFAGVTDGEFQINIDGAGLVSVTGLSFGATPTLTSIASVIDTGLTGASAAISGNTIVITSGTTGASSSIVMSAGLAGTDITTSTYLDITTGTTVAGAAAGKETVGQAIIRTKSLIFYVGILATQSLDTEMAALALANQVQAYDDKIIFYPSSDTTQLDSGSLFDQIRSATDTQTRCLLYTSSAQNARLFAAAYASRGMSVNFNAANTTNTMHLKTLATIIGDTGITDTLLSLAITKGVDTYVVIESVAKVFSTGGNEFFDNVFNLIWFVAQIKIIGFNSLATTPTKIPQTDPGMEIIKGAYRAVCLAAVNNRFVGPGTWTAETPFGDPEDFNRNIEEVGYYVFADSVNSQSAASREAREAPIVQIGIKFQGAIHSSNVIVYVNK